MNVKLSKTHYELVWYIPYYKLANDIDSELLTLGNAPLLIMSTGPSLPKKLVFFFNLIQSLHILLSTSSSDYLCGVLLYGSHTTITLSSPRHLRGQFPLYIKRCYCFGWF